jgi:glycine/D-amino acid oxidase-like deaminating enzyme
VQNGGHCQPAIWDAPPDIARFELSTFHLIQSLIEQHSIACDWHVVGGMHAIYSPLVLAAAKRRIAELEQHGDLKGKAILIQDPIKLAAAHMPNALAAVYQPNAAKLWPYKLISWILEDLLATSSDKFCLRTRTPVTFLRRDTASPTWRVETPHGAVSAKQVLFATNAYTPHLLPSLAQVVVPVRAQIAVLEPVKDVVSLEHTYVWTKGADHQYLIQRGPDDGENEKGVLIFGGERFSAPGGEEGIYHDDVVHPAISAALCKGIHDALHFPSDQGQETPLQLTSEWTGIMGYSRDGGPWVGPVPSSLWEVEGLSTATNGGSTDEDWSTGLFVSAGYTGHGMPVAAQCGIKVAEMMLGRIGRHAEQQGHGHAPLPKEWLVSQARIDKVKNLPLPITEDDLFASLMYS